MFLVSSVLKRDAYFDWGPLNFFANLFVFLVAPPRKCAKSTTINWGTNKILENYHLDIEDPILQAKKKVNILRSKGTAEGLFDFLRSKSGRIPVKESTGKYGSIELGATVSITVSELATFLGRQKYNVGLIEKLTDLYDCKDYDDDLTKGQGHHKIKDLYVTLFGATTASGLRDSIPEAAFGEGFMSRIIIVYQETPTRCFPTPKIVHGAPTAQSLSKRLAWIAENAQGKFTLSKEAKVSYEKWYHMFHNKSPEPNEIRQYTRLDNHLLRTAMLIRAQRYERGTEITVKDFNEALIILESTLNNSHQATDDVGASLFRKCVMRISQTIQRHEKGISRRNLLRYNSRDYNVQIIHPALNQLYQEGRIEITVETKKMHSVSTAGVEVYKWITD